MFQICQKPSLGFSMGILSIAVSRAGS
jgi:hypothetical protein